MARVSRKAFFGLACAALSLMACRSFADISAGFTDGNDTTNGGSIAPTADSFKGTAGGGWTGAWVSASDASNNANNVNLLGTVSNAAPFSPSSGNYLSVTGAARSDATGNRQAAWNRPYGSSNGVSLTAPHRIEFDWRAPTDLSTFTNAEDRFAILEGSANNTLTAGNMSWSAIVLGADNGTAKAKSWGFYNGGKNGSGFDTNLIIDTGVALVPSHIYRFVIDTDPANKSYNGSIEDLSALTPVIVTKNNLGFRANTTSTGGVFAAGLKVDSNSESSGFDLDNINISPIPEPATLGLLASAGLFTLRRRRHA